MGLASSMLMTYQHWIHLLVEHLICGNVPSRCLSLEFCDLVCPFNKFQYSFGFEDLRFLIFFERSDLYSLKDLLILFLYALLAFCIDIKCSLVLFFLYFRLLFWYIFLFSSHDLLNQGCNGCWRALPGFLLCLSEVTTPASDAASFKDEHISLTTSSIIFWFTSMIVANTSRVRLIFSIEWSFCFFNKICFYFRSLRYLVTCTGIRTVTSCSICPQWLHHYSRGACHFPLLALSQNC